MNFRHRINNKHNILSGQGKSILSRFLIFVFILLMGCKYDDITTPVPQIYLEGKQIPGTEMYFPQGQNTEFYLYGGEPLLPKVSPDGTKLLYTGNSTLGNRGLWVMDLTTQAKTLIIIDGMNADWGPDSQEIYFNQLDHQIYGARIGGSINQLTVNGTNLFPVCSSDGEHILFNSQEVGNYGVSMIATDGTNRRIVVPNLGNIPAWYPSEERFFVCTGSTYDTTGTVLSSFDINLKYGPGNSSISPLDNRILINTLSGIYIVNSDGSALKRILPNHLYNGYYHGTIKLWAQNASWHPDGKHIIYEHFEIEKAIYTGFDGTLVKGTMSFYKVDADSAIMVSNLDLDGH